MSEKVWQGLNRGARLGATAITHTAMHPGDARTVSSRMGLGLGL